MVREVIISQKNELEQKLLEKYVPRETNLLTSNFALIQVIIGPRRAGKSFFGMHHLIENKSFGFANFDDERLVKVQNFDEILENILAVYSNPKILLLDEVQNLPDWEIIVNRLQRQGFQLIITGSNSKLLSHELATHLTGRHLPVYIFTFSFSEYLAASGRKLNDSETREQFDTFLLNGGYPEPLMKTLDYREYLQILFDSILFKDIVKRYRIRNAPLLENLATWLISNISGEFSLRSLTKQTQISSVHTIKKYIQYLEDAFVFFTISRFSYKVSQQLQSNKKIYCCDNGFFKAKAFQFSANQGRLLENVIATELMKRSFKDGTKIYYWKDRDQGEIDFIIQQGAQIIQLIQVCWSSQQQRTYEREVKSLLKASKKLRCDQLIVITYNEEKQEHLSWYGAENDIHFIPAWKWLTNNY